MDARNLITVTAGLFRRCLPLLLVIWVASVYAPVCTHDFVEYDDQLYVYENPDVQQGLTWSNLGWAMVYNVGGNWHPVTMYSHMLDCNLFGLWAGGHHLTSLLIHAASVALLFWILNSITQAPGRSALAALLFGIHPLNVDSVAWIAERKNVLSTFFWMLTIIAYLGYVRRPCRRTMALTLLAMLLGISSKSMLLTAPVTLLLLDFWPLRRWDTMEPFWPTLKKLAGEKMPLFILSVTYGIAALMTQHTAKAFELQEGVPLLWRVEQVLVNYMHYMVKLVWPAHLSVLYPYAPGPVPFFLWGTALMLMAAISVFCWRKRQEAPYLITGWAWYLVTLLPVSGLIPLGVTVVADRYAYVPLIGLFVIVSWGLVEMAGHRRWARMGTGALVLGALIAISLVTRVQLGYWKNSVTLFTRASEAVPGNYRMHDNLGRALIKVGRMEEGVNEMRRAALINPRDAGTQFNLGVMLYRLNKLSESEEHLRAVRRLDPDSPRYQYHWGRLRDLQGFADEALTAYTQALARANSMGNAALARDIEKTLGQRLMGGKTGGEGMKSFPD